MGGISGCLLNHLVYEVAPFIQYYFKILEMQ